MKRHALFVGVDQYTDPTIQNLEYPSEDAAELASVFRRLLKFDRVEKLVNPAHAAEVLDCVDALTGDLGPGDLFLFFFAGHGFRVKENHVLVCARDKYAELEDEYDGLPVGRLKKRMRGAWSRMLVLDACQNDIRTTRGADTGFAGRDLELIHTPEFGGGDSGCQIVVTSCSEGQKALEVSDLRHGLFTSALLDSVTSFADARRRIDIEALRTDLGARMGSLIAQYNLSGQQEPLFTMPANAAGIVLLDGAAPIVPTVTATAVPSFVVCPICGKKNRPEDTFKCRECGHDNLCLRHQDETAFICRSCATENAQKAQEEAVTRAAEARDCKRKGDDYRFGTNGVAQEEAQAVKWYRKAAEMGDAEAQNNMGWIYAIGTSLPRNDEEAVSWFRKAAEQGNARAQFNLGMMYDSGRGVAHDDTQAVAWFRKAAEQGDADAQFNLGLCHANGSGVPQNDTEAVTWFRQAAEQEHAEAQFSLGMMHMKGCGVEQDDTQAVAWFRKAAEQGDADAQYALGLMYFDGRGVARDDTQAVAWFRQAAEKGNAHAQFHLGVMYDNGYGVAQDDIAAATWFRKSAEQGDAKAQYNLGVMYGDGSGVPKDEVQAASWFRKAAEQGDARAQYDLAVCYESGDGVPQDDVQAEAWFRKAAEQGDEDAKNALRKRNLAKRINGWFQ